MASLDNFGDTPHQIRNEGREITLTRTNVDTSTVLLSWNLPPAPYRAYNGIILTASTTPFVIGNAPVNGTKYKADPTTNPNLHAGDKLGTSIVIGAFYGNITTTTLQITGVNNNKPIYFSAFAVTKEFKYHTEGVHSYEQTLGGDEVGSTAGYQQVLMGFSNNSSLFDINFVRYTTTGIPANDITGLNPNASYKISLNCDKYPLGITITIHGSNAQTYQSLVNEINDKISQVGATFIAGRPSADVLYVDIDNEKIYLFDGETKNELTNVTFSEVDFTTPYTTESYWFDNVAGVLYRNDGGSPSIWTVTDFFYLPDTTSGILYWTKPDVSAKGYKLEGTIWCERTIYHTAEDPRFAPFLESPTYTNNTFWYNTDTQLLYKAHVKPNTTDQVCWDAAEAIYNEIDPHLLPGGYYWHDDVNNKIYIRSASPQTWIEETTAVIQATAPTVAFPGMIWLDTTNNVLNVRNSTNTAWEEFPFVTWGSDPTIAQSCDLWWNSTNDTLYIWSFDDNTEVPHWIEVQYFYQQSIDPSLPLVLAPDTMWRNLDETDITKAVKVWDGSEWTNKPFILFDRDPVYSLTAGQDVIYDINAKTWNRVTNTSVLFASSIDVVEFPFDPTSIPLNSYWYDTINNQLGEWNGTSWAIESNYVLEDPTPIIGYTYYDTADNKLYTWDGVQYVDGTPFASIGITTDNNLLFTTANLGSTAYIYVTDDSLFTSLNSNVRLDLPRYGTDGIGNKPSYVTLGVGTDGSSDERRNLIDDIRLVLGNPIVGVELTRQQLDHCVELALRELRKRSSVAYKRVMFFIQVEPHIQKMKLTNKTVGYNKIVNVTKAYRMKTSFLGGASGQGAYGQAMLQHLYQMGSFDLVSYHLISEYVETMNLLFASDLSFTWDEYNRTLSFYKVFGGFEKILLDCTIERTEQELITDRMTTTWIEKYACALAKLKLSQIRGKFASLPGAGGGVSLNAGELATQAQTEMLECIQEIEDYIVDTPEAYGANSSFLMG